MNGTASKCRFCPPHCEACKGPGCECYELVDGHGQLPGGADLLSERDALAARLVDVEALLDRGERAEGYVSCYDLDVALHPAPSEATT